MKRFLQPCAVLIIALLAALAQAQKPAPAQKPASRVIAPAPQVVITDAVFHSPSLGRDMKYSVILPAGYQTSVRRYPVLYLLHGLYGDHLNWITNTDLIRYAAPLDIIIVMPDADDSWYTNSATVPQDRYEDYIVKDVVAEIDSKYRTLRLRRGRTIAGLSMGGYAAMKFGLRHPDLFATAGSLSGALNAPLDLDETEEYRAQLLKVFGERGSETRAGNDVFALARSAEPSALPYLFLSCGAGDQFLRTNRNFVALLQERRVAYEYHEYPGRHAWEYWDTHIQNFLQVAAGVWGAPKPAPLPVKSTKQGGPGSVR